MIKVLSIIGTRPEAIKMAPVVRALQQTSGIESVVCSTGQHKQMLDQVFNVFGFSPDIDLQVMTQNQSLAGVTGRIIERLDPIIAEAKPDWILAQGDTTTVLCAGLLAYYHNIRFGHVEAGLRTGNKRHPFPEEMNRRLADVLSDAHFAPTAGARECLLREGFSSSTVFVTGNTVVDAVLEIAKRPRTPEVEKLASRGVLANYVLVTAHRRESFGEPFKELCRAIRQLADESAATGMQFIFPVHLNPNVRAPVNEILAGVPNVLLLEPLDYPSLVHLLRGATFVLTDSGGIQEEAPAFNVPVLVMRETTERPEGVEAGLARLVGTSFEQITSEARKLLQDQDARDRMKSATNPYGDGFAAQRIVEILLEQTSDR